jgi:hypothetical protein
MTDLTDRQIHDAIDWAVREAARRVVLGIGSVRRKAVVGEFAESDARSAPLVVHPSSGR